MNMIKVFTFVSLFAIIGLSNGISQTITTSPVSSPLCAGTAVNVQYHVSSNFNGANLFRAELSDSSGSFITYNVIGVLADSASSIIHAIIRSEEHTSELQSLRHLVCRLLLEKK